VHAAVWYGGKDVRIEELPIPRVNNRDVLVKVKSSGICGSDLHAFEGRSKRRVPPLVMGHEFAGIVADAGVDVQDFRNGDRIVVEPKLSCGKCDACRNGKTNICSDLKFIGLHAPGGFAEYVKVPAEDCHKLPDDVSFDEASIIEPLAVAIHALEITPKKTDDLLVIGAGVVGLLITMVAAKTTGRNVIVSDVFDYKLELAKKLGASVAINSKSRSLSEKVVELTIGKGVDAVIEAVGIQQTLQQAMTAVKKGGHVTVTGLQEQEMLIDVMKLVNHEITLRGGYLYTTADFEASLSLAASKALPLSALVTHAFPLTEISKAVAALTNPTEEPIKILLTQAN
jgi:L-iditol 2-dehydrogenase